MQTTESSGESLSLDSAVALIMEPETPETEEAVEEEVTQPEEDVADEPEADYEDDGEVSEEEDDDFEEESDDSEDEDYEDDDAEEADEEPDTFTVKVDGEEVQVSLDELKQGYSGQKYVQKGMQQAAEARKQAEAVYEDLMRGRKELAKIIEQARDGKLVPPQPPSRELLDSDPFEYMSQQAAYSDKMNEYQAMSQDVQQQLQMQAQHEERAKQQYMAVEAQKLVEKMPELSDPDKAGKFRDNLLNGAKKHFGYTPEQVAMVGNHQDLLTLNYAIKYAEMMEGKEQVARKVKKAKPVVKAGAKKTRSKAADRQKALNKVRKTGSDMDALSLLIDPNLR